MVILDYYMDKWDLRFLDLAQFWAEKCSRDPSTKVGAVITKGKRLVSMGYNGFPAGVEDKPERYADRDLKYKLIVHGEINAIVLAGQPLEGTTLYTWPFMPCSNCAGIIIQSGITKVVAPENDSERWQESFAITRNMFREAGVQLIEARY